MAEDTKGITDAESMLEEWEKQRNSYGSYDLVSKKYQWKIGEINRHFNIDHICALHNMAVSINPDNPQGFADWLLENIEDIQIIYEDTTKHGKKLNIPYMFTTPERGEFYDTAYLACGRINPDNPMAVAEMMEELIATCKASIATLDTVNTARANSTAQLLRDDLVKIGGK